MKKYAPSKVAYAVGRFQPHLRMNHYKPTKKIIRYLKSTKYFMLTFSRGDKLPIVRYVD